LLKEVPGLDSEPEKVLTNILMVGVARTGFDSNRMVIRLKEDGVLVSALDSAKIRLVTHLGVTREHMFQAADAIKSAAAV
jgi:threonine aldolase